MYTNWSRRWSWKKRRKRQKQKQLAPLNWGIQEQQEKITPQPSKRNETQTFKGEANRWSNAGQKRLKICKQFLCMLCWVVLSNVYNRSTFCFKYQLLGPQVCGFALYQRRAERGWLIIFDVTAALRSNVCFLTNQTRNSWETAVCIFSIDKASTLTRQVWSDKHENQKKNINATPWTVQQNKILPHAKQNDKNMSELIKPSCPVWMRYTSTLITCHVCCVV